MIHDKRRSITYVVSAEVMDIGLGQHGVVFKLTLSERRCVSGNDDELCLA